jgi:hypothetical protein
MLVLPAVAACSRPTPPEATPPCAVSPVPVDSSARAQLVEARDAVWRAWFAGDSAGLVRLLPEPMVGMGQSRAEIIAEAQGFARGGGRLVKLDFTCDEFFLSGDVAVVYSNYRTETSEGGKPSVKTGRAIEVFERRDGKWVNPSWHLDENSD